MTMEPPQMMPRVALFCFMESQAELVHECLDRWEIENLAEAAGTMVRWYDGFIGDKNGTVLWKNEEWYK